jgi:hypothetical protein
VNSVWSEGEKHKLFNKLIHEYNVYMASLNAPGTHGIIHHPRRTNHLAINEMPTPSETWPKEWHDLHKFLCKLLLRHPESAELEDLAQRFYDLVNSPWWDEHQKQTVFHELLGEFNAHAQASNQARKNAQQQRTVQYVTRDEVATEVAQKYHPYAYKILQYFCELLGVIDRGGKLYKVEDTEENICDMSKYIYENMDALEAQDKSRVFTADAKAYMRSILGNLMNFRRGTRQQQQQTPQSSSSYSNDGGQQQEPTIVDVEKKPGNVWKEENVRTLIHGTVSDKETVRRLADIFRVKYPEQVQADLNQGKLESAIEYLLEEFESLTPTDAMIGHVKSKLKDRLEVLKKKYSSEFQIPLGDPYAERVKGQLHRMRNNTEKLQWIKQALAPLNMDLLKMVYSPYFDEPKLLYFFCDSKGMSEPLKNDYERCIKNWTLSGVMQIREELNHFERPYQVMTWEFEKQWARCGGLYNRNPTVTQWPMTSDDLKKVYYSTYNPGQTDSMQFYISFVIKLQDILQNMNPNTAIEKILEKSDLSKIDSRDEIKKKMQFFQLITHPDKRKGIFTQKCSSMIGKILENMIDNNPKITDISLEKICRCCNKFIIS